MGDVVLFKGQYYMSMTSSNNQRPDYTQPYNIEYEYNQNVIGKYYWSLTQSSNPKWESIQLWDSNIPYNKKTYVIHNEIVYISVEKTNMEDEPGISNKWQRIYSMVPDTDIIYNDDNNQIIEMNNSYYMINNNLSNSTLDNGINIYINKKWKNILININISDNTIPGLTNSNRDDLYNELSEKLTAFNFIQCINNITNKYGFTDYLNYIIIDENNNIKKYNFNNIEGLPYYIMCEEPDEINMKSNSLSINIEDVPKKLKANKILSTISPDLSNLNYYNKTAIAVNIKQDDINKIDNIKGIKNDIIYRFSGFYMPIFYSIDLFESPKIDSNYNLIEKNYKFDTTLTNFGIIKERKIRKVNHKEHILKLYNNVDEKSIYPMIDEFGYTVVDSFIFKSTWDIDYHIMTSNNSDDIKKINTIPTTTTNKYDSIGVQENIKNINL
jgi:phage anti-repressor protein